VKKKSSGKKSTGKKFSGPTLTAAQRIARYKSEAAKARKEAAKARRRAAKYRVESRKASKEAISDLKRAAKYRASAVTQEAEMIAHQYIGGAKDLAEANTEWARAEHDVARAKHYDAESTREVARAARDKARASRESARAVRDDARAARDMAKARSVGLIAPGATVAAGWILGGNDWHNGCACVAIANHLYAATGHQVADEDIINLYAATTGNVDVGASVGAALATAARYGLGGHFPASWQRALPVDGALVELALTDAQRDQEIWDWKAAPLWGRHAGLVDGKTVITWGRAVPVTSMFLAAQVTRAWQLAWE
jgi:hypothetical protein